jgi:hypothetical protein
MVVDGFNALFFDLGWSHLYAPDLRVRLGTGLLAGVAMAQALLPAIHLAEQPTSWFTSSDAPNGRDDVLSLLGGSLLALAVLSGWSIMLLPVSLLGAGGIVVTWTLFNRCLLGALIHGKRLPFQSRRRNGGLGVWRPCSRSWSWQHSPFCA